MNENKAKATVSSSRHRREMAEEDNGNRSSKGDGTAADSATKEEEEDLGLHSMTAKGIKHLCSELLEIKKASEQDFRANVYLSYLSFIRMFQEAGALEEDLHRHVLAHRRLVQHLSNNDDHLSIQQSSRVSNADVAATMEEVADEDEDEYEMELELDVLLSEHRMEEVLELRGQQALQIKKWQARVADRFASIADNPRTPRPELLKALSGLCKLGDAQRANHLLFKFYSPPASQPFFCLNEKSSIKDLASMVFSSILEASRSFVALHGHPSPHTPELVRWAREEMEDFSVAFSEYVKSSSSISSSQAVFVGALEAAKCALSYCSLLRVIVTESEQHLLDLIAPCLREVLTMYAMHLKEVTRLFVASDAWVLGRFPVSGILARARSSPAAAGLQIEYCLLTTSGRKLLTLIQDVVEDVYPLLHLRMDNPVLQLVAELFREYMHSIVELIPRKELAALQQNEDQQYMWQLSVLVNCTTLVSLFPIIAHGIFDVSTQGEPLDSLILLIKAASGQVWNSFCRQFIGDTMSGLQNSREGITSSSRCMMPSLPFQVLFARVRQLNNLYGTILTGKDGAMKKLLQELMEAMIFWLSNNLDSWIHHVPRETLFQQIQLDVHFLLEFAQLGGFSSENIRDSAQDLLTKAEQEAAYCSEHDNRNSGTREARDWATDAAKHAVGVLMASRSSSDHEASVQNAVDAQEEGYDGIVGKEGYTDTSASEDPETGACEGGKSSDEFISIEEDGEDGMSSEELKMFSGSSHQQAAPDDTDEAEDELDAIGVEQEDGEVISDQGTVVGGAESGQSRRSRQASSAPLPPPPPPSAAEKSAITAARSSRKKRGAVSRSSRPRWQ